MDRLKKISSEMAHGLIMEVVDGNPGAATIVARLLSSPHPGGKKSMLEFCRDWGIVGANLWMLYKDIFEQNLEETRDWIFKRCSGLRQEDIAGGDIMVINTEKGRQMTFKKKS